MTLTLRFDAMRLNVPTNDQYHHQTTTQSTLQRITSY